MKKILLIALAMVCVSSYAATTKWKFNNSSAVLKAGYTGAGKSSDALANYTVYVVASSTYTQNALISGLRDGSIDKADFIANGVLKAGTTDADGKIIAANGVEFELSNSEPAKTYSFYEIAFATVGDKEYMFASVAKTQTAMADPAIATVQLATAVSQNAYLGEGAEFSAGGWYDVTATIPEPTSALLAMLGLAGLALRRKQK